SRGVTSKSYEKHPAHKALYDALIQSLLMDKNDMDRRVVDPPFKKKRLLEAAGVTSTKNGFPEFYKELEAEFFKAGTKLMGLQLFQLEIRVGKNPSRSFRPVKSAEILCQFWT
ncbi:hypothetical protein Tco_1268906, partial [Tanacetum coccineum]